MADLDGSGSASSNDDGAGGAPDPGATGAPSDARYLVATADAELTDAVNLGTLTTGLLKHTVSGGVSTPSVAVSGTDYQAPLANVITAQAYANPDSLTVTATGLVTAITAGSAKALQTTQVIAGSGLSGGGTLAADRTLTVATDGISDTMLRNSAALSVIGRSANSSGDPADIAAGTDGHVLRRSGTTLGFGTIAAGAFAGTQTNNFVLTLSSGVPTWLAAAGGTTAHSSLTGLTSGDDHTQYALLTGRGSGQTFNGHSGSGGGLVLMSTQHATKGTVSVNTTSTTALIGGTPGVKMATADGGAFASLEAIGAGSYAMAASNGTVSALVPLLNGSNMYMGTYSNHICIFRTNNTDAFHIGTDQVVNFASAGISATGAQTVTYSTTNGPGAGALTVVEYLKVKNAGGTVRYIPLLG